MENFKKENSEKAGPPGRKCARPIKEVYDRQAAYWHSTRQDSQMEINWLNKFLASLPASSHILDLGCGTGAPLAPFILQQGHRLTGIDFSPKMIDLARKTYPEAQWIIQDMRALELTQKFDGILSWDAFFHLTPSEQRRLIPQFGDLLHDDGALLLTVGPEAGEVVGHVGAEGVYHASLSPAEYKDILSDAGLIITEFMPNDPACGGHTLLLAQKTAAKT